MRPFVPMMLVSSSVSAYKQKTTEQAGGGEERRRDVAQSHSASRFNPMQPSALTRSRLETLIAHFRSTYQDCSDASIPKLDQEFCWTGASSAAFGIERGTRSAFSLPRKIVMRSCVSEKKCTDDDLHKVCPVSTSMKGILRANMRPESTRLMSWKESDRKL